MKVMKHKRKFVVEKGGPSQIDLTSKVELEKTPKEIELECNKRKMIYELNQKYQNVWAT
jgi:hypothetical protein